MRREHIIGVILITLWVYLLFFSYPSVAWVGNGNVHVINWDGFNNWYVETVEGADGFDVVVLTEPDEGVVDSLLDQGRNVLVLTNDLSGCIGSVCYMELSFNDVDYKYTLFYLSGRLWLYWLNLVAPVFLLLGLVLLKDLFLDKRFALLIILAFSLFGARKYILGMPMTTDFAFHEQKIVLISEGKTISDLIANGITTWHYYPPLFYWFWSLFVNFIGLVGTVKLLVFFTLFFAGISAYVAIRKFTNTNYATIVAVFYMLYPFLLSNINIRGGLSEAFSFAMMPWVFVSLRELLMGSKKYGFLFVVSLSIMILTHIPTAIIMLVSVVLFTLTFETKTKARLKALCCISLSLILASFWLLPLLIELNFTSHSATSTIDPMRMFLPRDWSCKGIECLLQGYYVGFVIFPLSVVGVAYILLSKKRKTENMPFIWLFFSWFLFLFWSETIFNIIPIVRDVLQYNARCLVILGFVSCILLTEVFNKSSSVRKFGRYIWIVLLFAMVVDVYKMTGAPIHSNNQMITLFSLDGFGVDFEVVAMPSETIPAMSQKNDGGTLFVSLEPIFLEQGTYFGHQVQTQTAASVLLGREVAGIFPWESTSNDYGVLYEEAMYNIDATEEGYGNQQSSLRFSQLIGYLGADTVVMTSEKYDGNGCMELINETEKLFVYNNTCAQNRISVYRNAVNVLDGCSFARLSSDGYMNYIKIFFSEEHIDPTKILLVKSREPLSGRFDSAFHICSHSTPELQDYLDSFEFNYTEPEIDVSISSWEDDLVELEINAGEPGFVMIRKTAYPDWELYVDGIREEILVAEPAFIALRVDEGMYSVRLVYSYWNWRHLVGLILSILGLLFLTLLFYL